MTTFRRPLVPPTIAVTAAAAAAAMFLVACDGTGDGNTTTAGTAAGTSTVTSTAPVNPAATTVPNEKPLGSPDLNPKYREAVWTDPAALLTGIRTGRHNGFDRVVFDFIGEGEPGWKTSFVDVPTQDGSGHVIDMAGDAYLMVILTGTTYPFEHGVEDFPTGSYGGVSVVQEVVSAGVFEGQSRAFLGLDKERPYSVTLLKNPTRVVVDVEH